MLASPTYHYRAMNPTHSISSSDASAPFVSTDGTIDHLLNSSNAIALTNLAAISAANADKVYLNFLHRMDSLATPFFSSSTVLREILRTCDAAVSGSSALHLLLPVSTTTWKPKDLDLYVPHRSMNTLTLRLQNLGYQLLPRDNPETKPAYTSSSHILCVHKFSLGENTIDVIESCTDAGFSSIFQFHSTALMNFIGADTIFCAYPDLTLQYKSLLNPYSIYKHTYDRSKISHLEKYRARGFKFIPCQDSHTSRFQCRTTGRTITDEGCLWININTGLRVVQRPADNFYQFGILDVEWRLGGHVCGSDCFLRPRVHIIKDKS